MNQNMNYQNWMSRASSPNQKNSNKNSQLFRSDATSKGFENPFQMGAVESSKASQQLTVNSMMPMCFYGVPSQNTMAYRMPGKCLIVNAMR